MRISIAFLFLLLSACGFEPANRTVFDESQKNSRAIVPPITLPQAQSKAEFLLKAELEKKLAAGSRDFHLTWEYQSSFVGSNLSVNDNYQRFNKRYTLKWNLYNRQKKLLKSGKTQTNIAIDILKTGYPFEAAIQDADRQAAKVIAQDVYNQLQIHFHQ